MGAIIPASILMSNNQSVVENKKIFDDNINDVQSIDDNDLYASNNNDKSKTVGDIINANSATCFAEGDTSKTANEWMGITNSDYVKFTITKDYVSASNVGTVSVSGTSAWNTITSSKLIISSYIINNGNRYDVKVIGAQAFYGCHGFTALDLTKAKNLTTIGFQAFHGCLNLTGTLIIPSSAITIVDEAFYNCSKLTGLELSNAINLEIINEDAFEGCSGLISTLTIPSNVISIVNGAFSNCSKLTSLDLTKATKLKTISNSAFYNCTGLTGGLTIPSNVVTIEDAAFENCSNISKVYFTTGPSSLGGEFIFANSDAGGNPINNQNIEIYVKYNTKKEWIDTPNILTKLGIASEDQIIESSTPASILPITLDKEGPYVLDNTSRASSNVVKASSAILPAEASQDINWTITTKNEATKPNNINIDTNGQVTIDPTNTMQPIKYDLTITATCPTDANLTTTKDIIIYIAKIDPISFDIPGPFDIKNNITTQTKVTEASSSIQPTDANLSIKWSIVNADDTNAPSWITIDQNGQIDVNNTSTATIGNYPFKIIATCTTNETITITSNFNVNIIQSTTPTITLDILDQYEQDIDVKAVSFKTIFTAKATINDSIDQDVSWSLPLTTEVQINSTTGEVQADITKVNTYTFIITATMKNDPTVTASKTITIKIIDSNIPANDFPTWAYLTIIGAVTVLVSALTITIVTINRKNKDE